MADKENVDLDHVNDQISKVDHLIASLKDTDSSVSDSASDDLGKLGELAVLPLIKALNAENQVVRWRAAEALGRIQDIRAVEPLIDALNDNDNCVRSWSASAL